jgi:hypothetical protein
VNYDTYATDVHMYMYTNRVHHCEHDTGDLSFCVTREVDGHMAEEVSVYEHS